MALTGYLLSDGETDLSTIFLNINNGASLKSENTFQQKTTFLGDMDVSGNFYGRGDGSLFDISFNSKYPIGYTKTFTFNKNMPTGVDASFNPTFIMSPGVWIVNLQLEVLTGSSVTGSSTSYARIYLSTTTPNSIPNNSLIIPSKNDVLYQFTQTYLLSINTSMTIIVKNPASLIFNAIIVYTSATVPQCSITGGMTKIA